MSISKEHQKHFDTLIRAIKSDEVVLLECIDKVTGDTAVAICAVNIHHDAGRVEYEMVPLARMFGGNPYDELVPPQAEVAA